MYKFYLILVTSDNDSSQSYLRKTKEVKLLKEYGSNRLLTSQEV